MPTETIPMLITSLLAFIIPLIKTLNVEDVGLGLNVDRAYLQDIKIDWDEKKAYFVFPNRMERWVMQGNSKAPLASVTVAEAFNSDSFRALHLYNKDRLIRFTRGNMYIYDSNLTLVATHIKTVFNFMNNTSSEFSEIHDLGGWMDHFVMKAINPVQWALVWLQDDNTPKWRKLDYMPDEVQDLAIVRKGLGLGVIHKDGQISAYDLLYGNLFWRNNHDQGNPKWASYMYHQEEFVTIDNDQRIRRFNETNGRQLPPPPIEWINHTIRDVQTVKQSDLIFVLTNNRAMVIDASNNYRIAQYRNTTESPPGTNFRYDRANYLNQYFLGYEDHVSQRNYRLLRVNGTDGEVCHPNCNHGCKEALQYCEEQLNPFMQYAPFKWFSFMYSWPEWLSWLVLIGLLLLCCCLLGALLAICSGGDRQKVERQTYYRNDYSTLYQGRKPPPVRERIVEEVQILPERVEAPPPPPPVAIVEKRPIVLPPEVYNNNNNVYSGEVDPNLNKTTVVKKVKKTKKSAEKADVVVVNNATVNETNFVPYRKK